VRGFIDDSDATRVTAKLMASQSAFVRGFIDDLFLVYVGEWYGAVSIRVRARLHR